MGIASLFLSSFEKPLLRVNFLTAFEVAGQPYRHVATPSRAPGGWWPGDKPPCRICAWLIMFDWGVIDEEEKPAWMSVLGARTDAGRLFVIEGHELRFPPGEYQVRLFNQLRAFGYVQDKPVPADFEFHRLSSADRVHLSAQLSLVIQAKEDAQSLRSIVEQRGHVEALVSRIALAALKEALERTPYSELKFSPAAGAEVREAISRQLELASPYRVHQVVFDVISTEPELDGHLVDQHILPIIEEARRAPRQLEEAERQRQRQQEEEDAHHKIKLDDVAFEQAIEKERRMFDEKIRQRHVNSSARLEELVSIVTEIPNWQDRLSSEQRMVIEGKRIASDVDIAALKGFVRGYGAVFNPELFPDRHEILIEHRTEGGAPPEEAGGPGPRDED